MSELNRCLREVARMVDRFSFTKKHFIKACVDELGLMKEQGEYLYNRLIGRNLIHTDGWSDIQRRDFLDRLDKSAEIETNEWETKFLASTMPETNFTLPQRQAIDRMITKYRDSLRW